MTVIVLGIAEQSISVELSARLEAFDEVELAYVADTTHELVSAVLRYDPDVVIMHDRLGPEPLTQVLRDLSLRRPTTANLILTSEARPEVFQIALEAAARGVLSYPISLEDLQAKLAAAVEWSAQMRSLLGARGTSSGSRGRGRLVAFAGAKGGVGATVVATHLAWDLCREVSGLRVCLVDLDLGKGDVPAFLSVSYRVSVADLAKVHEDISDRAVADSVTVHESGLHLLLGPLDVRDIDYVSATAVRQILTVMRDDYDVVVVDVGARVTPVQASVVEIADEVVAVVTPDVAAVRSLRREVQAWEALGARKADQVRVMVNRRSRQDEIQAETLEKLVGTPLLGTALPAMYRKLEPAQNSRDPELVREKTWWSGLRALGRHLELVPGGSDPGPTAVGAGTPEQPDGGDVDSGAGQDSEPTTRVGRRSQPRRRLGRSRDSGQVAIETVAMVPLLLLVVFLVVQLCVTGVLMVWVQHAGDAAAHAAGIGGNPVKAARDSVPDGVAGRLTVTEHGDRLSVSMPLPLLAPGLVDLPGRITATKAVVEER
jgi:pilus assembly protein CpaE